MKVASCIHSFAVLALTLFTLHSVSALSIDSKDIADLQPRLDGGIVARDASSSSSPTRRRKKCSFTPSLSNAALSTGGILPLATGSPVTNPNVGDSPANNASTLGHQLSYARSYKTTCTKKTGTVYLPSSSAMPGSSGSTDSGLQEVENGGVGNTNSGQPSSAGSSTPTLAGNSNGESSGSENGSPGNSDTAMSSAPGSGSSGSNGSGSACGLQQTVTVTSQTTITMTQVAQVAASAGAIGGSSSSLSGLYPQDVLSAASSGSNAPIASANASTRRTRTKCTKGYASNTAGPSSNSNSESSGSGSDASDSDISGSSSSSLPKPEPSESALTSSEPVNGSDGSSSGSNELSTSSNSESSLGSIPYKNTTSSDAASPSGSSPPTVPFSGSNSTNNSSSANLNGQFWAGATIGTVMRMEAIPSRVFYDFDGKTVKDPIKTLGDAGVNALRVEGFRDQCLGPTQFINNASTLGDELLFKLDWGCLDIAVKTAQRGVAQGMRVVLTINQGFDIPNGMESYTYEQMVDEVKNEAKRQLQPFLDAKIVPDVILFENEGSDGFLFNDTATGHIRGNDDGKASKAQVDKERCGQIPTGNMNSFPQYAGYLKAEVAACNDAITSAGLSTATVRYGLHSHGQYVQWKEGVVHGPNPASQTELKDSSGNVCSNSVIPPELLSANASELITIMGFSAYADPMTPVDINSPSSQHDALNRTLTTLTQLMGYAEAYGKYESGPFAGQYKLQALGVEYGTTYAYDQIPQEQQITTLMWSLVKQIPNVLGMLWYEPWYCHGDWEGGRAALCHNIDSKSVSGQAPTNTLKTWGAAALSPWKK